MLIGRSVQVGLLWIQLLAQTASHTRVGTSHALRPVSFLSRIRFYSNHRVSQADASGVVFVMVQKYIETIVM
jgi:hypothetical protein